MARDLKLQVVLQALDRATRPMRSVMGGSIGLANSLKQTRDHLRGLQNQQRDVSSFRSLSTATQRTGAALQASQERVRQLSRELGNTQHPTKALNSEFRRAVREAQGLKSKHQEQQRELQGLRSRLSEAGISTRNLGDHERRLRTDIATANQALGKQEAALRRVTTQQQRLARAREQYQKTQQLAGSMATTGAASIAAGSGMLYAGARFMAPGLDFDASMSKVQSLARLDRHSEEYRALRAQARQLGASTQFTAGQAADAQGFLAMAGFNPNAIMAAMPGMLDLAKAGDSDLAQTADIASNILSGFGLQADKMGNVGDVLVGTFTRSNTNLQMLGETMKYAAPVAAALGQDIETVAAMAGKLGDAGIQGSMGGTALRAIMNRLSAPPKMAANALDALGVSAKDAMGNMRQLPNILEDLYRKTEHMGNAERAGYLKAIAGEEAVSGLTYLMNQAGSGELQGFIATLRQTEGEASNTAKVMADNMRGDLAALGSAWQDLGIQMMETQDGPLRGLVQSVTGIIGKVKAWTEANPELTKNLVMAAGAVAGLMVVFGGLTLVLASLLGPFAMIRYGLTFLGIKGAGLVGIVKGLGGAFMWLGKAVLLLGRALMLNPIGLAITAIAGGAYLIYRNWDKVVPFFKGLWGEIKEGFNGGLVGIAGLIVNFSPVGLFYRAFAAVMGYFGIELPAKFSQFGRQMLGALLSRSWDRVTPFFSGVWREIKAGFSGGLAGIAGLIVNFSPLGLFYRAFAGVMNYFGVDLPAKFTDLGGMLMSGLVNGIREGLGAVKNAITGAGAATIGWFKDTLGIRSPSRVFAALGDDTMAGLQVGLERSQRGPLSAVLDAGKAMAQAGALALGIGGAGQAVAVDSRPALAATQAPIVVQGDTITIQLSTAPGTDLAQLEQMINRVLDQREQQKAVRIRSALYDTN
ncbi:phage tail tape measure protein [Pseudomonas jilinensis]|uniref:Phage tail tape measure protein n=1 Tax=Pseudomonas jilinensis TaxID=2078689 RepID=A0A396SDW3_9PSED|nr:phage tail tape measure protein [Pseudomonas jilinensis]RHW21705.1 phage tail tape measure protein [Pseudomonas jilinensis]